VSDNSSTLIHFPLPIIFTSVTYQCFVKIKLKLSSNYNKTPCATYRCMLSTYIYPLLPDGLCNDFLFSFVPDSFGTQLFTVKYCKKPYLIVSLFRLLCSFVATGCPPNVGLKDWHTLNFSPKARGILHP
jgi:hypothetical protein